VEFLNGEKGEGQPEAVPVPHAGVSSSGEELDECQREELSGEGQGTG
jgi:hypothetical protein